MKIAEDADLVTIQNSNGEPAMNLSIYHLFVTKGAILRQSKLEFVEAGRRQDNTYAIEAIGENCQKIIKF